MQMDTSSEIQMIDQPSSPHERQVQASPQAATVAESSGIEPGTVTEAASMRLQERLQKMHQENTEKSQSVDPPSAPEQARDLEKQRKRNLIFDEERFEDTFLKCLICREYYNDTDKMPKMLPCHHTFCLDCLSQMFRVEGEFRQSLSAAFLAMPLAVKIHCPTCREGLITSEAELRRLPNDHTIRELLVFVKDTTRTDMQYCSKHQMQPMNFFCEPCSMPICCDCTVIDHKDVNGHVVVNVDEALKKYTPILSETIVEIESQQKEAKLQKESLEAAADKVDVIYKDLTQHIRAMFGKIRSAIDERERELLNLSTAEIGHKRQLMETHLTALMEREKNLMAQSNILTEAQDTKDLSQMFTGYKKARELLEEKLDAPPDCSQGTNITFQFSTRNEAAIRQQIANLGIIVYQQ